MIVWNLVLIHFVINAIETGKIRDAYKDEKIEFIFSLTYPLTPDMPRIVPDKYYIFILAETKEFHY